MRPLFDCRLLNRFRDLVCCVGSIVIAVEGEEAVEEGGKGDENSVETPLPPCMSSIAGVRPGPSRPRPDARAPDKAASRSRKGSSPA